MFNSTEDFFNYATFGTSGMLKGAFSPEEQFSKEHWLNSFAVATSVFGIRGATKSTGNTPNSSKSSASQNSGTKDVGKSGADNIALHAKYKEVLKVTESANPIVDSLRQTGKLPSNYVNKDVAALNG